MLSAAPALAHPHVFADASAGFTFDGPRLTGVRIVWLYDAFTTLVLYDQLTLDEDGDGLLDDADLARVAKSETTWEPGYEGDTYLFAGDRKLPMGRPENGSARMVGDRVEVSFDLPLAEPLDLTAPVELRLYDPVYYYDYTLTTVLPSDLPTTCHAEAIPFEPSAADSQVQAMLAQLSAEEVPEDQNIGARFADRLRLTCG